MCLHYHYVRCEKNPCSYCKFFVEYKHFFLENFDQESSEELISYFQDHRRKNYNDFHQLTIFLKSIAEIERQRLELDKKLKQTLETWNVNTKI